MSMVLTERQSELIKTLCAGSEKEKVHFGENSISGMLLPDEIEKVCELISNEMMMNGIEETFEPNEYGKELEALLDAVNRARLHDFSCQAPDDPTP
jgi:hypothetical protein